MSTSSGDVPQARNENPPGYPARLDRPLVGNRIEWERYFDPIKTLVDGTISRIENRTKQAVVCEILRSMLDVDRSMRHILVACQRVETEEGLTACWLDATLLARPQIEAVFVILLGISDNKYFDLHEKWSVLEYCQELDWQLSQINPEDFGDSHAEFVRSQVDFANEACTKKGISKEQREVAIKKFRGEKLSAEESKFKIEYFPIPSQVHSNKMLRGSRFEVLGSILYWQYKFLCGPLHMSARFAGEKSNLRGTIADPSLTSKEVRENFIINRVQHDSIFVSGLALVTACTAVIVHSDTLRRDAHLGGLAIKAWEFFDLGYGRGRAVYQGWARSALGVLG